MSVKLVIFGKFVNNSVVSNKREIGAKYGKIYKLVLKNEVKNDIIIWYSYLVMLKKYFRNFTINGRDLIFTKPNKPKTNLYYEESTVNYTKNNYSGIVNHYHNRMPKLHTTY